MKKVKPSRLDLSLLGRDLLGSDTASSVSSLDLVRDRNAQSRVASLEIMPGALIGQEAKGGGK